jgi:hypothetical protein
LENGVVYSDIKHVILQQSSRFVQHQKTGTLGFCALKRIGKIWFYGNVERHTILFLNHWTIANAFLFFKINKFGDLTAGFRLNLDLISFEFIGM